MSIRVSSLLFGDPVKIAENVYLKVPTVRDVIDDSRYDTYFKIFTIKTREIFVIERNIEELVEKYPSIWSFLWDPQADNTFGRLFSGDENKTLTEVVIEAIGFLTGLKTDGDEGFHKLENGHKLVHLGSNWIIDGAEFKRFGNVIKFMTAYSEPDDLAPHITSDAIHEAWVRMYKGKLKMSKRKSSSWTDRIILLSMSANSYISVKEIADMSIFTFYQTFALSGLKDAYSINFDVMMSPKFATKEGTKLPKHWKESFNTGKQRYLDSNNN